VLSTTLEKSIAMEQNHIRTEQQSQPTKDSKDVEVAKDALYAQQLQGVKGVENTPTNLLKVEPNIIYIVIFSNYQ
jgi:hypothetical protein